MTFPLDSDQRMTTGAAELFPEMAATLHCWVQRFYRMLVESNVAHVFFLSREGQPLKWMFELYRDRIGGDIAAHYLEVSRRSTLLPSLDKLETEAFETLFRQYRTISVFEFLSSLGLEDCCNAFARQLGLEDAKLRERIANFPESETFTRLLALSSFQDLYERRRLTQRDAFIDYLGRITGGTLPDELVLADVGWKGTIQDHLHALLCHRGVSPVRSIKGFYVGLVDAGRACTQNRKHGVLFSRVGAQSPKFSVFNENRSLFEVLLAADHGSIVGYKFDNAGHGRPVRGSFDEFAMLSQAVFPVQRSMLARFRALVEGETSAARPDSDTLKAAAKSHARMVFHPSPAEAAWFRSVFHVENFGVFERSQFESAGAAPAFWDRMRFLFDLGRRSSRLDLGFWPWCTIKQRAGAFPAMVYAALRQMQP